MKKPLIATLVLLAAGSAVFAANSTWQEPEMQKPSAEHKALHQTVGNWEGTITMFMPGVPEIPMPASEVVTAFGPFWVQAEFTSPMGPMEYKGTGSFGYDPESKMHTGTWIDNMGSYLSVMKGKMDKETNTLTMKWKAPNHEGKMAPHRNETVRTKNAYTATFYTDGVKTMVIDMKRVAEAGTK